MHNARYKMYRYETKKYNCLKRKPRQAQRSMKMEMTRMVSLKDRSARKRREMIDWIRKKI